MSEDKSKLEVDREKFTKDFNNILYLLQDVINSRPNGVKLNKHQETLLVVLESFRYDKDITDICKNFRKEKCRLEDNVGHYKILYQKECHKNEELSNKIKEATTSSGLFISEVRRRLGF